VNDDLAGQIRREYPLLCLKGFDCRSEDRGGPRRTNQSWICDQCTEYLKKDLEFIAKSWDDLADALVSSEIADGEKGKQKHGMVSVGTNLNEKVMAARQQATEVVWFIVGVLRDDFDDMGRAFNPPPGGVPELANWIALWHVDHLARGTSDETALEVASDVADTKRRVRSAAYPSGIYWVEVGLKCEEYGMSELGERIPCEGVMRTLIGKGLYEDFVCTVDETHTIDPAKWQREGWHRAHQRLHPDAMALLAKKIAT
jgi:hypothetical protein